MPLIMATSNTKICSMPIALLITTFFNASTPCKNCGKKEEKRNSCIITQGPNNSITILRQKAFRSAKKPAKEEIRVYVSINIVNYQRPSEKTE
jgi:hypothetical protein